MLHEVLRWGGLINLGGPYSIQEKENSNFKPPLDIRVVAKPIHEESPESESLRQSVAAYNFALATLAKTLHGVKLYQHLRFELWTTYSDGGGGKGRADLLH